MPLSQSGLGGAAYVIVVAWQTVRAKAGWDSGGPGAKYNSFLFTEDAVQRERVPELQGIVDSG